MLLTFGFGRRFLGSRRAGFIAAVLMASALGVVVEAHLAKTDAALLAAVVAGQGALGLVYAACPQLAAGCRVAASLLAGRDRRDSAEGAAGAGAGAADGRRLSIADRDIHWVKGLRPLAGLLAMAHRGPWLIAVQDATGGHFISDALSRDLLPKLVGAQESHGAPPGYYLAVVVAGFGKRSCPSKSDRNWPPASWITISAIVPLLLAITR